MKKLPKPILTLLSATIFLFSGCNTYSLIKDATDREEGRIIMNDGTEYVGRVKMPHSPTKKIRIKTTEGQKVKLKSTDVYIMGVWKKTNPDNVTYLVCHPYYTGLYFSTKKRKKVDPSWMCLEAKGRYVEFYILVYKYSINSKGVFKIAVGGGGLIQYLARKKDDDTAIVIGTYKGNKDLLRKELVEYLSDDPELCSRITDMEIEPDDFSEIADKYRPQNEKDDVELPNTKF